MRYPASPAPPLSVDACHDKVTELMVLTVACKPLGTLGAIVSAIAEDITSRKPATEVAVEKNALGEILATSIAHAVVLSNLLRCYTAHTQRSEQSLRAGRYVRRMQLESLLR